MRLSSAAWLLAFLSSVYGFKDTSPLLIWSTTSDNALRDSLPAIKSGVIPAEEVYSTLMDLSCDWHDVLVAHVEDLHQSHLQALTLPSMGDASVHIPYLTRPSSASLDRVLNGWADRCGAETRDETSTYDSTVKRLSRVEATAWQDISAFLSSSPDSLLILTGSPSLTKRQEAPFPSEPSPSEPSEPTQTGPINTTLPTSGPLLERAQLLTTPIITSLLISFGILVPILYVGISALVGIQVPPRMMEIAKGTSVTKDRKDQ